jgi:hypothetical protein
VLCVRYRLLTYTTAYTTTAAPLLLQHHYHNQQRRLCESLLEVDESCCLAALHAADVAGAPRLRAEALCYLAHMLDAVAPQPGFSLFLQQSPAVAEELVTRLARAHAAVAPVAAAARRERRARRAAARAAAAAAAAGTSGIAQGFGGVGDAPFPWGSLIVAIVTAALYSKVGNAVSVGWVVPAVNALFFTAALVWAFKSLGGSGKQSTTASRSSSSRRVTAGTRRR